MIKRELTIEETFRNWVENKTAGIFSAHLFSLIDKANLDQVEQIRLAFPDHVRIFEDYVSGISNGLNVAMFPK